MCRVFLQIFVAVVSCFSIVNANENSDNNHPFLYYKFSLHRGWMTPHYQLQAELNNVAITGLDVSAVFLKRDERAINSSVPGFGYFLSNLGNNDVYGYVHSAYLSILFPLIQRNCHIQLKTAIGPAYATMRHHPQENPLNRALGSHINVYGQISLTGGIPVKNGRYFVRTGLSFNHVSNGLIVAPNQGINTVTIHTGLDIISNHRHSGSFSIGHVKQTGKDWFNIAVASGLKQVDEDTGKSIFTSSLIFDYGYRILPSFSAGAGINIFYNDTWAYDSFRTSITDELPVPFQSALHLVLELDKNPFSIILNPGFYIYAPADDTPGFTGRLGFRYSLRNNISFMFAIKHHWFALADYFEWGIGYRF